LETERRRLVEGETLSPVGMTDEIRFRSSDTAMTIRKTLEVLRLVRTHEEPWPSQDSWRQLLPGWFVDACPPGRTQAEQEEWERQWRTMSYEERHQYARTAPWTLEGWLAWFHPDATDLDRGWSWVDAKDVGSGTGIVAIEIDGWPYSHGTLDWLLRTAGATEVEAT
jgi:hypothetical protein